jgi:hypothetical protein
MPIGKIFDTGDKVIKNQSMAKEASLNLLRNLMAVIKHITIKNKENKTSGLNKEYAVKE